MHRTTFALIDWIACVALLGLVGAAPATTASTADGGNWSESPSVDTFLSHPDATWAKATLLDLVGAKPDESVAILRRLPNLPKLKNLMLGGADFTLLKALPDPPPNVETVEFSGSHLGPSFFDWLGKLRGDCEICIDDCDLTAVEPKFEPGVEVRIHGCKLRRSSLVRLAQSQSEMTFFECQITDD